MPEVRRGRWVLGIVLLVLLAAGSWIVARVASSPDFPAVFSGP